MTAEQKARDMLERMGVADAQGFSAGNVVELANLIAARDDATLVHLPRFAVMLKNEHGNWDVMTMAGLMTYEQANAALERHRSRGYSECYIAALSFVAGPSDK